jgi:glutaredoxin
MSPDGTCVRCRRDAEDTAASEDAARVRARQRVILAGTAATALIGAAIGFAVQSRGGAVHAPAATTSARSASTSTASAALPLAPMEAASVAADPVSLSADTTTTPLDRAMHAVPITMYCRPPPECERARAWLQDGNYAYKERNVAVDPMASAAWQKIAPNGTVPAFDIEGQTFVGFDPERIKGALAYAGARRLQR